MVNFKAVNLKTIAMESIRQRPKGNYLWKAEWSQLYLLAEHWKSDLEFYKGDLTFLHHLIEKYFIWIINKQNTEEVKTIAHKLYKLKEEVKELLKRVDKHLTHLSALSKDPFTYDSDLFRKEHETLEDDIVDFVKNFRSNRMETFKITEHVVELEKLEHLLTN
ncbi:hypothetical protein [Tenacibaculum sp. IB213877]|uniref:hypothetical protein n=1 Tax=Tenacibaculum sp. IB213877 TaxID=3097351 RepID=UPI002A5AD65A|nr:hypothetical protein [Tenacibaculum sp. IB213877]MDY0779495.1 hypothetical protein [Tenacibaculum sp. IB213877]